MSDLEAAIAAEMRMAGCSPSKVDDCREHPNDGRWSDLGACPIVAAAVCAGWDAAINAADALDKQIVDALIADLREMDAHEAISLDTWRAAADFIERFADDEPTDHNVRIADGGRGYYRYRARCSCGWATADYERLTSVEVLARIHREDTA